ncbi:hypothetical protein [Kitasatospora sp. NPDC057198]|uniref:hypothetical protein n=1 Tax=Kitasatospora sp. NPDC057198 TaxID=3346046 RepID=UPI0036380DF2
MGVGVDVLVVDWARVEAADPGEREELLIDAALEAEDGRGPDGHGWWWPAHPDGGWYGGYAFRGTLGSYKPHFWAGHRWDLLRPFLTPEVRGVLDRFTGALFRPGPEEPPEQVCPWDADLLLYCPPDRVPAVAGWWRRAAPGMADLREPFERHAVDGTGRVGTFEEFAGLLAGWGEVVTEAERRGWGVVGLRC